MVPEAIAGMHLDEEPGADEELLYRRRAQGSGVRRGRLDGMWRVTRTLIFVAVLLPLALYGGYRAAVYANNSPDFLIDPATLQIKGSRHIRPQEVLRAVLESPTRLNPNLNIFRIDPDEIRGRLESLAWVASADVTRVFPNRLVIHLTERQPLAYVNVNGMLKLVDGDGVLLDPPAKGNLDFPVVSGIDAASPAAGRKSRIALYENFLAETSSQLTASGWVISEVYLDDPEDLKLLLVRGHQSLLTHFGQRDFGERFQRFVRHIAEVRAASPQIYSLDLRYNGQIVIDPSGPPPGTSEDGGLRLPLQQGTAAEGTNRL